jgi:hypothetical protein
MEAFTKARQLVDHCRVIKTGLQHIEAVFKRRDALVFIFEDDQVFFAGMPASITCQYSL